MEKQNREKREKWERIHTWINIWEKGRDGEREIVEKRGSIKREWMRDWERGRKKFEMKERTRERKKKKDGEREKKSMKWKSKDLSMDVMEEEDKYKK